MKIIFVCVILSMHIWQPHKVWICSCDFEISSKSPQMIQKWRFDGSYSHNKGWKIFITFNSKQMQNITLCHAINTQKKCLHFSFEPKQQGNWDLYQMNSNASLNETNICIKTTNMTVQTRTGKVFSSHVPYHAKINLTFYAWMYM